MSRSAARITCPAQQRPEARFPSQCRPPFRRSASPFPLLRRLLSVAVRPPFRCYRGSDPLLPAELCSVAHRVRPLAALLSVAARPPFRRSASSFPSLQGVRPAVASRASLGGTSGLTPSRPLSVAVVPPFRRSASPFRPPLSAPFPASCQPPCAAPLRHQSHRQSERIQPQRMPQNGYLTAKQRDIFFKTANYANVADIRLFENCAHSVAS